MYLKRRLEGSQLRDDELEAVDLLDLVVIGELDHVAQDAMVERDAVDLELEARHAERAAGQRTRYAG